MTKPKNKSLEYALETLLWNSRLITLLAVVFSLLASAFGMPVCGRQY